MNLITFDMNDEFPGRADLANFAQRVAEYDFAPWAGKAVQMRGCAPTWAHLMVAAQLLPQVESLAFLVDNGGEGTVVPLRT